MLLVAKFRPAIVSRPVTTWLRCSRCFSTGHESAREPLKILYCGSDSFSVDCLEALVKLQSNSPHIIDSIDVVHRPAKRVGRGLKQTREVPVQQFAEIKNLKTHQIDTFTGWTPPNKINLIVAVSFGLFVPPRILALVKYGGINVHPSLLPDLRGPAPVQNAILLNRLFTGITVQTLDPHKFDHGVRLLQSPAISMSQPHGKDAQWWTRNLALEAAPLLTRCIEDRLYEPPQIDRGWSHSSSASDDIEYPPISPAPKLPKEMGQIDWATHSGEDILRLWRAMGHLWDVTCHARGKRIRIEKMSIIQDREIFEGLRPGESVVFSQSRHREAFTVGGGTEPEARHGRDSTKLQSEHEAGGLTTPYIKTCDGEGIGLQVQAYTVEGKKKNRNWIPKPLDKSANQPV